MNKIKILPENITNKIAAGEVVERPASIVKELIENSIDAGANKITVEIKNGGIALIKVSDDGSGMSRDDALMCIERHATSKIANADDIYNIRTLGFRGEALSSIASVSKFELETSEGSDAIGASISIEGGKIKDVKEAGLSRGTVITVRDLFSNVPARRKFLKSSMTETSHIVNAVTLQALPYTDKAFKLIDNGKEIAALEKNMDLKTRIGHLFGNDLAEAMMPISYKSLDVRIEGFISKPEYTFSNRTKQYFFVNNRPVYNKSIMYAVSDGYRTLMPKDRFPFCFLFIRVNPEKIDVNIHPAKREVRFVNEVRIKEAVADSIRETISRSYDMPEFSSHKESNTTISNESSVEDAVKRFYDSKDSDKTSFVKIDHSGKSGNYTFESIRSEEKGPDLVSDKDTKRIPLVVGQTKRLYIIAETEDGIAVIDQHAAHERVLYEKTLKNIKEKIIDSQKLLLPVTIELPKARFALISQYIELIETAGIGINIFGDNTIMIDAVPSFVHNTDINEVIKDVIDELEEESRITRTSEMLEERIIKTLCREAVKAHDRLTHKEQVVLVEDLFRCETPNTCPHGRPTMIKLTNNYLEKEFKRK